MRSVMRLPWLLLDAGKLAGAEWSPALSMKLMEQHLAWAETYLK